MPRPKKPDSPPGTVWFGGHIEHARLTLRVLGDSLDPDEITNIIGRAPTHAYKKGGPRTRHGNVVSPARIGSWLLTIDLDAEETVEEGIARLLKQVSANESVWTGLKQRFKIDLICDVTVRGVNQGFEMSPSVLKLLSDRQIVLGVDIFPVSDEDPLRTSGTA